MNIAIIGAGLIGRKRAMSLPKGIRLTHVCDVDEKRGLQFAKEFRCKYQKDWKKVVQDPDINAIIVCTTNNWLTPIGIAAIKKSKHVLLEKPGGRNAADFEKLVRAQKNRPIVVQIGYNHRFHPAIAKAKTLIKSDKFGPILFIRAKYGHGGRLGYEKEWRFDKAISGGGELLDQGCHLIDLVNFFAGPMQVTSPQVRTFFWNTSLEDTAFWHMAGPKNQIAQLSVSCVEWKNIFQFEIMLKTAKIQVDGLGGSYGTETLTLFKMNPEMGPPSVKQWTFGQPDISWHSENKLFFDRIRKQDYSSESLNNALYVLKTIKKIYNKKQK